MPAGKLPVFIQDVPMTGQRSPASASGSKSILPCFIEIIFIQYIFSGLPLSYLVGMVLTWICRKHMDKHTRPYICTMPGCENRGFTYSGGLSRHQREVHGQHGGPTARHQCPHKDCKRSTGSGFSRKENLQEHLRRVHRQAEPAEAEPQTTDDATTQATGTLKRRRRRVDDEDDDGAAFVLREPRKRRRNKQDDEDDESVDDRSRIEDLSGQVKRLRKELQEMEERLRRLEQTVKLLTKRSV
ncbi:MAG: hypothetical protein Q9181_003491 [Wetmoreana brouardii]